MTLSPEERAEGICATLARGEAAFDKRGWVEMPKADRDRYVQRAMLAKPLIAAVIRDACNEKLEEASRCVDRLAGDHVPKWVTDEIRNLKDTTP